MTGEKSRTLDSALTFLTAQGGAMRSLLATLVRENSFTENVAGGRRVGDLLRDAFAGEDLPCQVRESGTFAPHLVFSTRAPGPPVALVGHLDTVFPPGTFEGYREEGNIARGPGVLDMKGGLVVTGFALRALHHVDALERLPLRWVVVSDEEVGSPEGQAILREVAGQASSALVFEGGRSNDAVVTARKGTGGMTALAHGRPAHAGNNHKQGINAIWALARFVDAVQGLTDYGRGVTVNVGRIEGGHSKNSVPERAVADIDIRFVTAADGEALVSQIHEAARRAASDVPGARIELSGGISRLPLARTAESRALYEAYAACARASGLGGDEAPLAGGGSDANTLAAVGVPAIDGLGPRGEAFHTPDEHIDLETLVPRAAALTRFLLSRLTS